MASRGLLVLILLTAMAGTAAAQSPLDRQIMLQSNGAPAVGGYAVGARVPPEGGDATIAFPLHVVIPPGTVCADPRVVLATSMKMPPFAHANVAKKLETLAWSGTAGAPYALLEPISVPWVALADVGFDRTAPAFRVAEFDLMVSAQPVSTTACNLLPSVPLKVPMLLVVDYKPELRVAPSAEPWGENSFRLDLENGGNGESRVRFEYLTPAGILASTGLEVFLDSPLDGTGAGWQRTVEVVRVGEPPGWNGDVRVTMESIVPGDGLDIAKDVVHLGTPPPFTVDPRASTDADSEIANVPGWGGMGTLAAAALVGLLRRLR